MGENVIANNQMVERILKGIKPEVLSSLSPEQMKKVTKSLSENVTERRQHSLDVHGVIPLIFKRFYFVFSSGVDNREETKDKLEQDQRVKTKAIDATVLIALFISVSTFFGAIIYKIIETNWFNILRF